MIECNPSEMIARFVELTGASMLALDATHLRVGSRMVTQNPPSADGVAVIPVVGPLASRGYSNFFDGAITGMDQVRSALAFAAANEQIGTIVLDMDTPGGTVAGTPETAAAVREAASKKRVIAVANTLAASAGCWIASQASEFVASPSADVGSIGVIAVHMDLSKYFSDMGVNVTLVRSGKYKCEANMYEPLSDEAKANLQAECDAAYAQFVKEVADARGTTPAKVKSEFGEGRTMTATQAKRCGLVDRVATLDEVVAGLVGGARATRAKSRRSAIAFL